MGDNAPDAVNQPPSEALTAPVDTASPLLPVEVVVSESVPASSDDRVVAEHRQAEHRQADHRQAENRQTDHSSYESLSTFRPAHRQFLRAGLALMLVILAIEWIVISTRRPDPLLLSRGGDFQRHFRVEINTATWVEWLQLEGIGQSTAHRIVADRNLNGPFASIDELERVPGIGRATLDRIRPWLTMGHDHSESRSTSVGDHRPSASESATEQRKQTSL